LALARLAYAPVGARSAVLGAASDCIRRPGELRLGGGSGGRTQPALAPAILAHTPSGVLAAVLGAASDGIRRPGELRLGGGSGG
jgi:hypothetical protein